jgi:hypothetical protein
MVPRLRNLVLAATSEQLGQRHGGGRRSLVTEANELALFPQWFPFAEEILFALARHETEPDLGNNATKVWAALFPIMCYVATPFHERLKIIQERIRSGGSAAKILCIEALRCALDDRSIHMVSGLPYGNRIGPTPWRPNPSSRLSKQHQPVLRDLDQTGTASSSGRVWKMSPEDGGV